MKKGWKLDIAYVERKERRERERKESAAANMALRRRHDEHEIRKRAYDLGLGRPLTQWNWQ